MTEHDIPARTRLVVLLPARNATADLSAWFESVERFADAVVALDDGSTDGTAEALEAHPLVEVLLRNPRRETYEGWDDGANRTALLEAAGQLNPDWILSLDSDETIPEDDAAALRSFIDTDALPGLVYGMACYRMWEGGCDPAPRWVYRLFSYEAGQQFPVQQLHFDPVPTSFPKSRHLRISMRIQHWGSNTDEQRLQRIAKYQEVDPDRRFTVGHGGLYGIPETAVPWSPYDREASNIVGARLATSISGSDSGISGREDELTPHVGTDDQRAKKLVVLLPARNAAHDLPDWFASVERFADAVVALDDGSTDGTAAVLDAHPMVEVLLRNPRRESYEGWDDSANRNALLEAAGQLEPDWILSLDADERISADDAAVLREFIDSDALSGFAYGMACYRMIDDMEHWDRNALWVFRLFAYEAGQRFPVSRLHFVPIPEAIPRDRWVRTTIRIQHISSLTPERRAKRLDKYNEADPDREYQSSYENLAVEPTTVFEFEARPVGLSVLDAGVAPASTDQLQFAVMVTDPVEYDLDAPALSAIVISRNDEDRIERVVRAVVDQVTEDPFEVVVVTSGTDRTAEIVRGCFPDVRVVELDHPALPGEARNAGLRVARGDYVSFPGSHVLLEPGSLDARIRAHDRGWAMVTGSTFNGNDTPTGWAAYFLDNSTSLPGRPSQELTVAPAHCSYDAVALFAAGGFPEDVRAGEDTVVNGLLFRSGFKAYRSSEIHLVHANRSSNLRHLVRHYFERGRAATQSISAASTTDPDGAVRRFLEGYPRRRLKRLDEQVECWGGDLRTRYRRVRPLVVGAILASWIGAHLELRFPTGPVDPGSSPWNKPIGSVVPGLVSGLSTVPPTAPHTATPPLLKPLRVVRKSTAPRSGTRAIFLHIPRTAGATLLGILEREYEGLDAMSLFTASDVKMLKARCQRRRRALQLIAGQMAYGVHTLLPGPSTYITLLRDPVERAISSCQHLISSSGNGNFPGGAAGVDYLEELLRAGAHLNSTGNHQTRLLGLEFDGPEDAVDAAMLSKAKSIVERDDVVCGLQERFDESVLMMRNTLGWGFPTYGIENRGVGRIAVDAVSTEVIELIKEHNKFDIELYEHATKVFESRLSQLSDLDGELALLRLVARCRVTGS